MSELEGCFFKVIELIEKTDAAGISELLNKICVIYNLKSAAYFGLNAVNATTSDPCLFVTYSQEWIEHYRSKKYFAIDPVLRAGFSSLLPVNWNELDTTGSRVKRFFGEAAEFGVGRNGLTFPVRGRAGERALFTITSNASPAEWSRDAPHLIRDFQTIAYYIHNIATRSHRPQPPPINLSPRELDCLRWKACGKTDWETAKILGISEKTVRFYIDLARVKLNAANVTHAVAKALHHNLILIPS
ncbi:LuxR family transcriptional regulator [Methylobacterium sp. JK268]